LVVVPALNEQETIGQVVQDVRKFGYSVLVIDDGSSDQTSHRARAAGASVLELSMNLGVGGALQSGFNFALKHKYEAVVQIDADGQHPANEINNLVDKANATGSDLVLGSRFLSASSSMRVSVIRRVAMLILTTVASRACRTRISDSSSGFRLIRNPLLTHFAKSFPSHYLGDTFEALVISGRRKYKIVEIPASIADRKHGQSSASSKVAILLIFRALIVTTFGLHFQLPKKVVGEAD
jgi:glycosyltransferase involved in cell wall biosynthesis